MLANIIAEVPDAHINISASKLGPGGARNRVPTVRMRPWARVAQTFPNRKDPLLANG